jgi:tRNA pseudouridine55 synthase
MLNGLLVVNKPKDISSHDVVFRLRRKLNDAYGCKNIKIGHTGTLDPFASGVLVLCLGDATKITDAMQGKSKIYIAELKLGLKTTTDDITGEVIYQKNVDENVFLKLETVIKKYIGQIEQKPPIYSAISVNGKRLYEYARKNKSVEIPIRKVFVESIEILDNFEQIDKINNTVKLKIACSSGTYIRALARDIGEDLEVGGTLQNLQRTTVGKFCIEESLQYLDVLNNYSLEDIGQKLVSLEKNFEEFEKIELSDIELKKIIEGNVNFLQNAEIFSGIKIEKKQFALMHNQKIRAILGYENGLFKIKYLFCKNF